MHGHRSDFRSANDHDFFVSRMDAVASERSTFTVTQDYDRLGYGCRSHRRSDCRRVLRMGAVAVVEVTGAVLVAAVVTVVASVAAISVAAISVAPK